MSVYRDVNGSLFTDEDIERWAFETEAGYTGGHLGPSVPGRPISVGVDAKPFTLRLDASRRAKLAEAAQRRHLTPSQIMRELIDAM